MDYTLHMPVVSDDIERLQGVVVVVPDTDHKGIVYSHGAGSPAEDGYGLPNTFFATGGSRRWLPDLEAMKAAVEASQPPVAPPSKRARTMQYGETKTTFSRDELRALGLTGDVHPYDCEAALDVEKSTNSHGTAYNIVFEADGEFWRITVGYHHEDWYGTNDLDDCYSLDAVLVTPKVRVVTTYESVRAK